MWRLAVRPEFLAFLLSRVWLVVGYTSVGSDVAWAYYPVVQGALSGAVPYKDVPFPYPPLALLAVMMPALARSDPWGYHLAFQAEMIALDVACFLLLVWFLEARLLLSARRVRLAMLVYAVLGFGVGNIIYDRLDLMIALAFMAAVCLHRPDRAPGHGYYLTLAFGTLAKIVPLFWLPAAGIQTLWARATNSTTGWLRTATGAFVVPVAGVALAVNAFTSGALLESLGQHAARGVEIESTWATPFVLARAAGLAPSLVATVAFGSVNLGGPALSGWVVSLSQYGGFALLGVVAGAAVWRAWRHPQPLSADRHLRLLLGITLLLVATQRVLSPQYLIWLIPGLAATVARADRPAGLFIAVAAIYTLTLALYPFGFDALVHFKPAAALALGSRNALIAGLAVWSGRDLLRSR